MELRVVRVLSDLGDDDALQGCPEQGHHVDEQVMGHWTWRLDSFEREMDGRCLRGADHDRQNTLATSLFSKNEHGRVVGYLDPDADELHGDLHRSDGISHRRSGAAAST